MWAAPGTEVLLTYDQGKFGYGDGSPAGQAVLQNPGAFAAVRRATSRFPGDARMDLVVYDSAGHPLVNVVKHRGGTGPQRVDVTTSGGGPLGELVKSRGLVRKTYQATDAWRRPVGEIREQKPNRSEPHFWAVLHDHNGTPVGRITHRTHIRPGARMVGLARNHHTVWELQLGAAAAEPLRGLVVAFVTVYGAITGLDVRPPGVGDTAGTVLPD